MSYYQRFTAAQRAYETCLSTLSVHDPLTLWAAQRADLLYKKLLAAQYTKRGY